MRCRDSEGLGKPGEEFRCCSSNERPQAAGAGTVASLGQMEQQLNCTARRMLRRRAWVVSRLRTMNIFGHLLACLLLTGCAANTDHHYPQSASDPVPTKRQEPAKQAAAPAAVQDVFNPLKPTELESVKKRLDGLQPYMALDECVKILNLPARQYPTSAWGKPPAQSISMMLREGSVLLIVCDHRGYVVSAQLGDKKWEWKKDDKKP
jgi:hypothetical protein